MFPRLQNFIQTGSILLSSFIESNEDSSCPIRIAIQTSSSSTTVTVLTKSLKGERRKGASCAVGSAKEKAGLHVSGGVFSPCANRWRHSNRSQSSNEKRPPIAGKMSDPTYSMISDFVGRLKNQLNKEKEEQEAREKDFHRHFQEREFEMEERESAWKRELERREVGSANTRSTGLWGFLVPSELVQPLAYVWHSSEERSFSGWGTA